MPPRCAEQVADDVVMSAFRSAGQRCSALRLLVVQEDVADKMIEMIAGARRGAALGDPRDVADPYRPGDRRRRQAQARRPCRRDAQARPRLLGRAGAGARRDLSSRRMSSTLTAIAELDREHFGPILHVVRWKSGQLRQVIARHRSDRLRADARRPFAHRDHHRARSRASSPPATSMSTAT